MVGIFLLFVMIGTFYTCYNDYIQTEDVTKTSCVFADLNITNDCIIRGKSMWCGCKLSLIDNVTQSYQHLIGHNVTCYYVHGKLQFDEPCNKECSDQRCALASAYGTIIGILLLWLHVNGII